MKHIPLALLFGAISSTTLSAQIYSFSPASTYALREGAGGTRGFGVHASARYQFVDSSFVGQPRTLRAVSFRPDFHHFHPATAGKGRSWSSVTLDLAAADRKDITGTWTNNPKSTPTRVFQASLSWPDVDASAWQSPGDWGYTMPFQGPWQSPRQGDLLLDYRFAGGTLHNQASWLLPHAYALDSYGFGNLQMTSSTDLSSRPLANSCVDEALPQGRNAGIRSTLVQTGAFPVSGAQSSWVLTSAGRNFGPNSMTVTLLSFRLHRPGFSFPGIGCQRLFLKTDGALVAYPVRASATGQFMVPVLPSTLVPRVPNMEGKIFGLQALWSDSVTGRLKLTPASTCRIPFDAAFPDYQSVPRACVWANSAQAAIGTAVFGGGCAPFDPITRFTL